MQDISNTIIAHYAIHRYLTKGGMSEIYLAYDQHTEQEVAIKLVHSSNQEYCQRFQREARAVASLHHEHILPALDYGEYDPWCYLVTPYISHGTLRDYTQQRPLPLEEAGAYLKQIASALQYAHDHGIIHRDIKASNIFMRDKDFVYLADFGLVKNLTDTSESLTESGYLIGTAEYMAPELAEEEASPASDIYSLGILLYQMLTGDVPFKGTTPVNTFMKHLSQRPPLPSRRNRSIPKEVEHVVMRALAKEPGLRYHSAMELSDAYQQALASYAERLANADQPTRPTAIPQTEPPMAIITIPHTKLRDLSGTVLALALFIPMLFGLSLYMLRDTSTQTPQSSNSILIQSTLAPNVINHTPPPTNRGSNHQSATNKRTSNNNASSSIRLAPANSGKEDPKDNDNKEQGKSKKEKPNHGKEKPKP